MAPTGARTPTDCELGGGQVRTHEPTTHHLFKSVVISIMKHFKHTEKATDLLIKIKLMLTVRHFASDLSS